MTTTEAHHPLLVTGRIAASMLGPDPAAVIIRDAVAAATASKDQPGRAWQLALTAAFPNSPPTHPGRGSWSDLPQRVADLFSPDQDMVGPCWLCGTPAGVRWGKALMPLAESGRHLNTAPEGGRPICQQCRIATWAAPYAGWHNGGTIITVTTEHADAQRDLIAALVTRNRTAIDEQWRQWPAGDNSWIDPLLAMLERSGQVDILRWRNDNREPALRMWTIEGRVASWYAATTDRLASGWLAVEEHFGTSRLWLLTGSMVEQRIATAVVDALDPLVAATRLEEIPRLTALATAAAEWAAGMQATMTTDQVRDHLGLGPTASVHRTMARRGVTPVGRAPGRDGQDLWPTAGVLGSKGPGRGAGGGRPRKVDPGAD